MNVSPAQQPHNDRRQATVQEFEEFTDKVTKGVTRILQSERGQRLSEIEQLDLCTCMTLLESKDELAFDWDINIYRNPPALKTARVATDKVGTLLGDEEYGRTSDDDGSEYDNDSERPQYILNEVYLVRLSATPYWSLGRSNQTCF